jgi:antitoxin (DNA-binding transcriptional repressor) of toxin-antitoxin stability system
MPAFENSSVGSFAGTSEELGTRRWPRAQKKSRNFWRISFPVTEVLQKYAVTLILAQRWQDLSKCLAKLDKGETILLCRRNQPIAEIRPIPAQRKKARPIGLYEGQIKLGPEFFEPLPDELLGYFNGEQ